jgi:type IV secretion system protein VirB11
MDGEKQHRIQQKLLREIGPIIGQALLNPDVVEIALNPDGKLWVEKMSTGWEHCGEMTAETAESLMGTIASCLHTTVTRENPILEGELPIDGSRFEGLLPPLVANPTFTIRKKALRIFTLADYVRQKVLTEHQKEVLVKAIVECKNILVVGGTGSGKTTFLNAIIHQISIEHPKHRLILIEDTSELQCSAKNMVPLHTSDTVDMQRLLRATMRLKPDRIMVGEVRGGEALALLKSWNTGHSGGCASCHADDGLGGLLRVEQLISEASKSPMQKLIAKAIHFVVVIKNEPGVGRHIPEILRVTGYDSGVQQYKYDLLT